MDIEELSAQINRRSWEEPTCWWGPPWADAQPRSLATLIDDGVLNLPTARLLQQLVAQGLSLVILAGPSGAGKTTLLDALLPSIAPQRRRAFPRGQHERFDFLQSADPVGFALLVNEISPHLPHYCWGAALVDLLRLGQEGAQILATAHATSVEEWVRQLALPPMQIAPEAIAAIRIAVLLDVWAEHGTVRREVARVAAVSWAPADHALRVRTLAARSRRLGDLLIDEAEVAAILGNGSESIARPFEQPD